jgi:hypothetical protein
MYSTFEAVVGTFSAKVVDASPDELLTVAPKTLLQTELRIRLHRAVDSSREPRSSVLSWHPWESCKVARCCWILVLGVGGGLEVPPRSTCCKAARMGSLYSKRTSTRTPREPNDEALSALGGTKPPRRGKLLIGAPHRRGRLHGAVDVARLAFHQPERLRVRLNTNWASYALGSR